MLRRIGPVVLLGWSLCGLVCGCGSRRATVSGEVTVNGQPLEHGVIEYVPADGNGPPGRDAIRNGRYEVRTAPGNKWVRISAPVVLGKRSEWNGPNAPLVEVLGESLPARYQVQTELTFEVQPGSNTKDWKLGTPSARGPG
jgi:hypothetical protein